MGNQVMLNTMVKEVRMNLNDNTVVLKALIPAYSGVDTVNVKLPLENNSPQQIIERYKGNWIRLTGRLTYGINAGVKYYQIKTSPDRIHPSPYKRVECRFLIKAKVEKTISKERNLILDVFDGNRYFPVFVEKNLVREGFTDVICAGEVVVSRKDGYSIHLIAETILEDRE